MNITIIQVVLTICISLFDIILIGLFFAGGIFFTLFQETTNDIAHFVGVSKGANLLLYSAILFLFFLILKLYSRLRKVEQKFTELVRNKSLEEAEEMKEKD